MTKYKKPLTKKVNVEFFRGGEKVGKLESVKLKNLDEIIQREGKKLGAEKAICSGIGATFKIY